MCALHTHVYAHVSTYPSSKNRATPAAITILSFQNLTSKHHTLPKWIKGFKERADSLDRAQMSQKAEQLFKNDSITSHYGQLKVAPAVWVLVKYSLEY